MKEVYISNSEKENLKIDEKKASRGRKILKVAALIVGGIAAETALVLVGAPSFLMTAVAAVTGTLSNTILRSSCNDYAKMKQENQERTL